MTRLQMFPFDRTKPRQFLVALAILSLVWELGRFVLPEGFTSSPPSPTKAMVQEQGLRPVALEMP